MDGNAFVNLANSMEPMTQEDFDQDFWINLLCTLFGWLPGAPSCRHARILQICLLNSWFSTACAAILGAFHREIK